MAYVVVIAFPLAAALFVILYDVMKEKADRPHERALALWTAILGIATVALFAATGYSAFVLHETDTTLRDALEAANRAWISPREVTWRDPVEIGKPVRLRVSYENTGREPAINVVVDRNLMVARQVDRGKGVQGYDFPNANSKCRDARPSERGNVVYPSTKQEYFEWAGTEDFVFTQEMLQRRALIVLSTCFAYLTMNKPRISASCVYLFPSDEGDPRRWVWSHCPGGNFAN